MEVVGGVASIVTLIEATGVLAGVSKDLVLRWRNAPYEIQALATRLSLLAAELQSIKNATARSHPVLTDAIIRQSLSDLLTDVRKRLTKLESLHFRIEQSGPLRQKIQWTMKDAGSAEKILNKTQEVEQRLANLMALISLRAQTPILDGLDRIEQMVSTLVIALPPSASVIPTRPSMFTAAGDTVSRAGSKPTVTRIISSHPWILSKRWEPWGLRGSMTATKAGAHTDYDINFSVPLPLTRILGNYALTACLSLSFYRSTLSLRNPSYFSVARVVENDHPFMLACYTRNMETLRVMLRSGEGRPTDLTRDGMTPMAFAVESGKVEIVAELLECGADVDAITDSAARTALMKSSQLKDPDMVRFLLQRGASTDPVDYAGYTAGSLCWRESDHTSKYLSMDIFKLLIENGYPKFDAHRTLKLAAMEACSSQIESLIHLGGDVRHYDNGWQAPMQIAAFNGNHSTYMATAMHYEDIDFKHNTQLSRWLLLKTIAGKVCHSIDLSRGEIPCPERPRDFDAIMMNMLQRGVDPEIWLYVPNLKLRWIPAQMQGQTARASEFAAAQGPDIEAWYLRMLRNCSLLESYADVQRLRELDKMRYGTAESVFEAEVDRNKTKDNVRGDSKKRSKDSDTTARIAPEDCNTHVIDDSAGNAIEDPDTDEADQFWDAEELG